MILEESWRGELFDSCPCIEIDPTTLEKYDDTGKYKCPLYKTTDRTGQLSTTGESSNFIMYFDAPTKMESMHWVRRGVAMVCLLND